jgi:hypothetical protein
MHIMIPIKVIGSPTAKRIKLIVACDQCGCASLEPFIRFHGHYEMVCRECAHTVNLKAKENRLLIEELAQLCARIDASLERKH